MTGPNWRRGALSPDTLILNAHCVTMNPALPLTDAVLIRDGRIAALGGAAKTATSARVIDADIVEHVAALGPVKEHFEFSGRGAVGRVPNIAPQGHVTAGIR